MTNTKNKLTEWVINKIKSEYSDDVALLVAVEGSSVNGDGHGEPFDYFVPATERGNELAQTFIIGGVGNDLTRVRGNVVSARLTLRTGQLFVLEKVKFYTVVPKKTKNDSRQSGKNFSPISTTRRSFIKMRWNGWTVRWICTAQ